MELLSEKYSLDEIAGMEVTVLADYLKEKGRTASPIPRASPPASRRPLGRHTALQGNGGFH